MTKTKMNYKKTLTAVLCVLLSVVIGAGITFQTFGEANDVYYLADIKLFYEENDDDAKSDAKKRMDAQGYKMFGSDLNQGTGKKFVYMGYKTTKNEKEAITDIRLLGMDTDYQLYNYKQLLEALKEEQAGTAFNMDIAAREFADAYEAGSPKAQDAYDALNLFMVDEDNLLGDYIVDRNADEDFFMTLLVKASNGTTNAIINYLNSGAAPYENAIDEEKEESVTKTWAEQISESAIWDMQEKGLTTDQEKELQKRFDDDAKLVFRQIQSFTTSYYNAAERHSEKAKSIDAPDKINNAEDAIEYMDEFEEEDADAIFIAAYEMLNNFIYRGKMKLGDWLLDYGLQTIEEVDFQELYPILDVMTEAQIGIIETNGLISAVTNLGENEHSKDVEKTIETTQEAIEEYNGGEAVSIWECADTDIETSDIALTTEAIRNQSAANILDETGNDLLEFEEKFGIVMSWISSISGLMSVAVFISNEILTHVATSNAVSAYAVSVSGYMATALSVVSVCSAVMFWVGAVVTLVNAIVSIVLWFIKWYEENFSDPSDNHTTMPAYVFDAPTYGDKTITVKYRSAKGENENGKTEIGDLNSREQKKWDIICFTKDTRVGSPIREDIEGNIFKRVTGNGAKQNGYDSAKYFGQRNPGDLNRFCSQNDVNGLYLHYRTEKSIKSEAPADSGDSQTETETSKQYISSLYLSTAATAEEAKARMQQQSKGYYLIDENLSPGWARGWSVKATVNQYTYLGYTITEDRSKAITDIRVAPYHGRTDSIFYGDIQYYYAGNSGGYADDAKGTNMPSCDAMYYTTDPKAGTPIGVDKIHICTKYSTEAGWEPVSLFGSDIPYNFNAHYEQYDDSTMVTGYFLKNTVKHGGKGYWADSKWGSVKKRYIYFEPETKYTGGQRYVSGVFFVGGASYVSSNWYDNCLGSTFDYLPDYLEKDPNVSVNQDINMAQSIKNHLDVDGRNYRVFIGYKFTYNPYRAIYNVAAFQGTTYTDSLPYAISKSGAHYVATNYIGMQKKDYDKQSIWRYIAPGNTYMNRSGNLIWDGDRYAKHSWNEMSYFDESGYAKAETEGIEYGYEQMCFLPTNLYISGYTKGASPIKSNDIVITDKEYKPTVSDGEMSTFLEGEKTIDGTPAQGVFHSLYEMKNPNTETPFNLSFPSWTDDSDDDLDKGSSLYVYLRGAKSKKKYISSLTVGSFSRNQYKAAPGAKTDDDTLGEVDRLVDMTAMSRACAANDEVIVTNMCANGQNLWYNRKQDDDDHPSRASWDPPSNVPAAYIGVNRTDDPSKAITGAILLITDSNTAPVSKTIDRVKYVCASNTSPIEMGSKKYFLYYTTNTGVNAGMPIENISIDDMPLKRGTASCLAYDNRKGDEGNKLFGDVSQEKYIHLHYDHNNTNLFYDELYIGVGNSKKEALCDLITQECVEVIDLDLNTDARGKYIYLGMRVDSLDVDLINSLKTKTARENARREQWDGAIYDIIVTNDKPYHKNGFVSKNNNMYYHPVANVNLNEGTSGTPLYMYYASEFYSGRYNTLNNANTLLPMDVYSTPYTALAMARYDRVPYDFDKDVESTSGESIIKWEHIMDNETRLPADLNYGAIKFNDDYYTVDNRVMMFAQRYDGSVKYGAEITGGFNAKSTNKGELYLENQD